MKYIARICCGLLLLLPFSVSAQDFKVTQFKENMMDLSAASATVKDRNGDVCALIKVSVQDDKFEFEPNMGIVKKELKPGEFRLYVPAGTKSMTIRHPRLGTLRGYSIPVAIQQKMTYEMELSITNKAYLQSLLERPDTVTIQVRDSIMIEKERKAFFNVGVGFQVMSLMGPYAHVGFNAGRHNVEVGAVLGLSKVPSISIYQADNGAHWATYDYKAMSYFARYGFDITPTESFYITPLVGGAITSISGTEVKAGTRGHVFDKTYVVQGTLGVRFAYAFGSLLRVQVTPGFNLGVKRDKSYDIIKEADSKLKSWGTGFSLQAGLILHI